MTPQPELVIKVVAMPRDANPDGDMFGGWIISQMDLAAYLHARKIARSKMVTVAIDQLNFHKPLFIGDCLICYAHVEKIGRTSMTIAIKAVAERKEGQLQEVITEGRFVFVAIDANRQPVPIVLT